MGATFSGEVWTPDPDSGGTSLDERSAIPDPLPVGTKHRGRVAPADVEVFDLAAMPGPVLRRRGGATGERRADSELARERVGTGNLVVVPKGDADGRLAVMFLNQLT